MRPNPIIVRAYVSRGAWLWLATRTLASGAFLLAGVDPLRLSAVSMAELILLSVVVSLIETHRCRERALLANLAVSPFVLGAMFAGPALIGEVAIRLGGAALR